MRKDSTAPKRFLPHPACLGTDGPSTVGEQLENKISAHRKNLYRNSCLAPLLLSRVVRSLEKRMRKDSASPKLFLSHPACLAPDEPSTVGEQLENKISAHRKNLYRDSCLAPLLLSRVVRSLKKQMRKDSASPKLFLSYPTCLAPDEPSTVGEQLENKI
jgi:hypothetical protein